jgi:threonine dehydrogenase-like Zn-dependent dehydrogenase
MRAVNLYGPGDLRVDEIAAPHLGERDVVIKIAACGICGTDLAFARDGSRRDGPMPLGHEATGVVAEAGAQARGFAPGMRVAINPMGEAANVIGNGGNGGTEGAFADYLLVRDAELGRNLIAVPDGLPMSIAAATEPLGVALHAVNRSGAVAGEKAVVFGVGPIGLGAVIWLKEKGVDDIVAVDLSPERLALAERFGARTLVRADRDDLAAVLLQAHGRERVLGQTCAGTDVYIDAAGAPNVVASVIALSKLHARLVIPAVYRAPVPVHFGEMLSKELTITTSIGYPDEFGRVVERLGQSPDAFADYITHRFPFARFHEAFAQAGQRAAGKVMVEFDA